MSDKKERHLTVIADGHLLSTTENDKQLKVVMSLATPITIERCKAVCERFDVTRLTLNDWRYYHPETNIELTAEELEGSEGCGITTETNYYYNLKKNSLVIYDDGTCIYLNADGNICQDFEAVMDTHL